MIFVLIPVKEQRGGIGAKRKDPDFPLVPDLNKIVPQRYIKLRFFKCLEVTYDQ